MRHLVRFTSRSIIVVRTLTALLAGVPVVSLAQDPGNLLPSSQAFLAKVKADEVAGVLSPGQALLYQFQFIFDQDVLPPEYQVAGFSPLKWGTDLVRQFEQMQDQLDASIRQQISSYLELPDMRQVYLSPGGHFQLSYGLSGADAVPGLDVDPPNGIPDFVESVGRYLEQAWTVEVFMVGFADPLEAVSHCPVSFRSMQNYGYCYIINENLGTTGLVLHNNFLEFPPNDDPEGDALGAAKVTAAHELKHASQYVGSRWAEGGWIELDAAWAEDLVFDLTNDYYNYLVGGSPIRHPDSPLDGGPTGTGSYEDCVFQIWMQEMWGTQLIVEFWQRRRGNPSEPVLETYDRVLLDQGQGLDTAWGIFTGWNFATGYRAVPGLGYGEAENYPFGPLTATVTDYPAELAGSVEHLAANFVRLSGWGGNQSGSLQVDFSGEPGAAPLTLTFVVQREDGTGVIEVVDFQGENQAQHTLSVPLQGIQTAGLVIGNPDREGETRGYQVTVVRDIPAPVPNLLLETSQVQIEVAADATALADAVIGNDGQAGSVLHFNASVWSVEPWQLVGDGVTARSGEWQFGGSLFLDPDDSELELTSPVAGQLVPLGTPVTVAWNQDGAWPAVSISWSADGGMSWQPLAEVPEGVGTWEFMAEGPASLECLVKITAAAGGDEAVSPGPFTMYPAAESLTCPWPSGQVPAGALQPITLNCDPAGMPPSEQICWLLIQHDGAGGPGVIPVTVRVVPGTSAASDVPPVTVLGDNFPNPFNPQTEIRFQLGQAGWVELDILDVKGRLVRRLLAGTRSAGIHRARWNGRDEAGRSLPAGVYLVRMKAPGFQGTGKMLLAK